MPKFEVRQTGKLNLTSYSGLALIGQCCEAAQIDSRLPVGWSRNMTPSRHSQLSGSKALHYCQEKILGRQKNQAVRLMFHARKLTEEVATVMASDSGYITGAI